MPFPASKPSGWCLNINGRRMTVIGHKCKLRFHPLLWVLLAAWWLVPPATQALDFVGTNVFVRGEAESIGAETWLMAEQIRLEGGADDDLFLLASGNSMTLTNGVIELRGVFRQDVWALGNNIAMSGQVLQHLRCLGRTVAIDGIVGKNTMLAGTALHLMQNAYLQADALLIGETIIAEGVVQGRFSATGRSVTLSGKFGSNVVVNAQDIVVLPGAEIQGNLVYRSDRELILDSRVQLHGDLIRQSAPLRKDGGTKSFWGSLMVQIWLLSGALLVGAVCLALFPAFFRQAAQRVQTSFWKCLLLGFVALAITPLLSIAAVFSIVGLPFGVLLVLFMGVLVYLSKVVVALGLGRALLRGRLAGASSFSAFAFGLLLLYVAAGNDWFGVMVWLLIACLGVGAFLTGFRNAWHSGGPKVN